MHAIPRNAQIEDVWIRGLYDPDTSNDSPAVTGLGSVGLLIADSQVRMLLNGYKGKTVCCPRGRRVPQHCIIVEYLVWYGGGTRLVRLHGVFIGTTFDWLMIFVLVRITCSRGRQHTIQHHQEPRYSFSPGTTYVVSHRYEYTFFIACAGDQSTNLSFLNYRILSFYVFLNSLLFCPCCCSGGVLLQ